MRPSEWARVRPRDVDCPTCGAPPGTSCTFTDLHGRRVDPDVEPVSFGYHWLRVELADEQDTARRRREYPACRCGSARPHLAGPACGPPTAEGGAPTAPIT